MNKIKNTNSITNKSLFKKLCSETELGKGETEKKSE